MAMKDIKVLGPGCANCRTLERATREAVNALGLDATIEKITDYPTIAGYGVMSTPALVVDEKVLVAGRVPTATQIRGLLTSASNCGFRTRRSRIISGSERATTLIMKASRVPMGRPFSYMAWTRGMMPAALE